MEKNVKRVLHVVSVMNMGGIENQIMGWYRRIDKSKIQFDFLVTREEKGIFDDEIKRLGGKIYTIPSVKKVGLLKFIKSANLVMKKQYSYSIIHSHMNTWSGLFLNLAKKNNIPVRIAHSHSAQSRIKHVGIKNITENSFKRVMKKFIRTGATNYWSAGTDAGKWLFGENKILFEVVPNARNLNDYQFNQEIRSAKRSQFNITSETLVLGHVGSFTKVKNHLFLIDLIHEMIKQKLNVKLILVGSGPLQKDIEEKVRNLNLSDHILFLGLRHDVNELLSMFDVFLLPSYFEGMPSAIIEAQAACLPCIISDSVSQEIDLGGKLVYFKSINEGNKNWISLIYEIVKLPRVETTDFLKVQGYDINEQIKWLEKFYLGKE